MPKPSEPTKLKWLLLPLSGLWSDLRHTSTTRARAEGKEEKAREGLRVAEGELREVIDGLQTTQNELRVVREELQAARGELCNKAVLLDRALAKLPRLRALLNA